MEWMWGCGCVAEELVFPDHALGGESFLWVLFLTLEPLRLYAGYMGNAVASGKALLAFDGLTLLVAAMHVYWLWWQVWVFHLDWILSWIAITLLFLEFVMASKVLAQVQNR